MRMIVNFSKTALRHFNHHRLYFFINVAGLGIAICCVLLAVLFVQHEKSYDQFHHHKKNLYRVITSRTDSKGNRGTVAGTGQPQGPLFKAAVPEILEYSRLMGGDIRGEVRANDKTLDLQMLFVDSAFFRLFDFPLVHGDTAVALKKINSVVITETVARKWFNSTDVIGKSLQPDANPSDERLKQPLVIDGVIKNIPDNSSIRFDILLPMAYMQLSFTDENWLNQYLGTFMLLKEGADIKQITDKFDRVYATHAKAQVDENEKLFHFDPKIKYGLQPVTEMHLNPMPTGAGSREGGIVNESYPVYMYLFLGIAIFILLMAAINFVNISIAGSLKRSREVGIRKISGGNKSQIIFQFLFESTMLIVAAFVFAIVLTNLALPLFNELSGKQLRLGAFFTPQLGGVLFMILVLVIILTATYPAIALSNFKPKEVLYNKQKLSGRNIFGRVLIVIQFSLAVFFIIATLIYYRQMNFIQTTELGYVPDQVIRTYIPGDRDISKIKPLLKAELASEPAIRYISFGGGGQIYETTAGNQIIEAEHETIDKYRLPAMGIRLKTGRNLDDDVHPEDARYSILVNEAYVKAAGLTNPLGTQIRNHDSFDKELKTIVGVIEDYHSGSLHQPIKPMVMFMCDWYSGSLWIKVEKKNQQQAINAIAAAYKKVMPTALFQYQFLDELNAQAYVQEQRWQKVTLTAALISIIICCMGLFGLAHQSTQRRLKEIGIRKILGAGAARIIALLSAEFLVLVIISILIAAPLAWIVMHRWITNFAYRTEITAWIFVAAAIIAIVISLGSIAFQTFRAASANPVLSLHEE